MEYFSSELKKKLAEKITDSLITRLLSVSDTELRDLMRRILSGKEFIDAPYPKKPIYREQVRNAMIERHKKSRDLAVQAQMSRKQLWRKAHP
jgi:hypothetical protein